MHLKKLSAYVVCCIYLLTIFTYVCIEATGVDQEQTALYRNSLISEYTVCLRDFRRLWFVIGTLRMELFHHLQFAKYKERHAVFVIQL